MAPGRSLDERRQGAPGTRRRATRACSSRSSGGASSDPRPRAPTTGTLPALAAGWTVGALDVLVWMNGARPRGLGHGRERVAADDVQPWSRFSWHPTDALGRSSRCRRRRPAAASRTVSPGQGEHQVRPRDPRWRAPPRGSAASPRETPRASGGTDRAQQTDESATELVDHSSGTEYPPGHGRSRSGSRVVGARSPSCRRRSPAAPSGAAATGTGYPAGRASR